MAVVKVMSLGVETEPTYPNALLKCHCSHCPPYPPTTSPPRVLTCPSSSQDVWSVGGTIASSSPSSILGLFVNSGSPSSTIDLFPRSWPCGCTGDRPSACPTGVLGAITSSLARARGGTLGPYPNVSAPFLSSFSNNCRTFGSFLSMPIVTQQHVSSALT
ncbi:unnamed protein product [Prunus armeniaca]|uniref:Uncharacterized protein n=1 Tax=Prunus armeniaca TaxID=36596 RepID=A0A6J5WVB9_PRUAR|nr:unnamed protein product [Prunus armeniaca]